MKVGITGSTGTLGKILVQQLKNYHCFEGDICSKKDIDTWVKTNNFSEIIHFAAIVPTSKVENNLSKAYQVNTIGVKYLIEVLQSCRKHPWLFYASTSHVYKSKNTPINELDPIEPVSEYGKTKYEAEKIILKNYHNYCIGRIFSFYHKTQKMPFLYPSIKQRLATENLEKPFALYGAKSVRDFLNAETVIEIIVNLMNKKIMGVYNIASGKGVKIKNFVQSLSKKKINIKEMGLADFLVADINKLQNALKK